MALSLKFYKIFLILLNAIFLIFSLVFIVGGAIIIGNHSEFGSTILFHLGILITLTGFIMLLVASIGIYGTVCEIKPILIGLAISLMAMIIIQIVTCILISVNRKKIEENIKEKMFHFHNNSSNSSGVYPIRDHIFRKLRCCGVISKADFNALPKSCCPPKTIICNFSSAYPQGCFKVLQKFVSKKVKYLTPIGIISIILKVLGIIIIFKYILMIQAK